MTLQDFQRAIDEWISQYDEGYWSPLANLARLTEEVGELSREINHRHGPKKKKSDEDPGTIEQELGDILFTLGTIANSLQIDLSEVATATLTKVTKRDADRWVKKSDA